MTSASDPRIVIAIAVGVIAMLSAAHVFGDDWVRPMGTVLALFAAFCWFDRNG